MHRNKLFRNSSPRCLKSGFLNPGTRNVYRVWSLVNSTHLRLSRISRFACHKAMGSVPLTGEISVLSSLRSFCVHWRVSMWVNTSSESPDSSHQLSLRVQHLQQEFEYDFSPDKVFLSGRPSSDKSIIIIITHPSKHCPQTIYPTIPTTLYGT